LDDGHADLAIRIRSEQFARNALELVPSANLARQHVIHAARRLNLLCSGSVQRNLVYLSFRDVSLSQIAVRIDREARELASFTPRNRDRLSVHVQAHRGYRAEA